MPLKWKLHFAVISLEHLKSCQSAATQRAGIKVAPSQSTIRRKTSRYIAHKLMN